MKNYSAQFVECKNTGFTVKGEFQSFEEHPNLLPLFPKPKLKEAIESGELKGLETIVCLRFGGECNSGHKDCKKLRGFTETI